MMRILNSCTYNQYVAAISKKTWNCMYEILVFINVLFYCTIYE